MKENETIADIVAEIRKEFVRIDLDALADRIEAAAKRERTLLDANIARVRELEDMMGGAADALLGAAIKQKAPGNAAAMREALEEARKFLLTNKHGYFESRLIPQIEAALAAPARNCDRAECATAEGAFAALRANPCANHDFCKEQLDCAECATRWLIAPAKKGGAE